MRAFELSHHRRANVWLDEDPPAELMATAVVTGQVTPKLAIPAAWRTAAVEICIPHGPMASYALLGGELLDTDIDGFEVTAWVSEVGRLFEPSLALAPDDVRVGLLEEYANAVIRGAVRVAETVGAPMKSTLRFRWAAHGLVGSSQSVFERASGIVSQLLLLPRTASDDEIKAVFR